MNPHARMKNHISNAELADKPQFEEIQGDCEGFLRDHILVAHNATVEEGLLRQETPGYQPPCILDTMALSRVVHGKDTKHSLGDLIKCYGLEARLARTVMPPRQQQHRAFYDAMATAYAFVELIQQSFPQGTTLGALYQQCAYHGKSTQSKGRTASQRKTKKRPRRRRTPKEVTRHKDDSPVVKDQHLSTLLLATRHKDGTERARAVETIWKMHPHPELGKIAPSLRACLTDPSPQVQQYAIKALVRIGDPNVLADLQTLEATTDNPNVRYSVQRAREKMQ